MKPLYALLLLTAFADSALAATPPAEMAKPVVSAPAELPQGHVPVGMRPAELGAIKVAKAKGKDARTVAEVNAKRLELKDKTVVVQGKVVKFTEAVMKKNWIHLRDGTGVEPGNDVLVTTSEQTKVGDVVTVKGTVRVDKDFGMGYAYKVLIEDAVLQK